MLGPLPHPPEINIKPPELFKGKGPVVAGHMWDCLEMGSCFLYIYISCYTSVLDGFLVNGSAASLDEHRLNCNRLSDSKCFDYIVV